MGKFIDYDGSGNTPLMCNGIETRTVISGTYTFSNSYTTGGESLDIGNYFRGNARVIIGSFPVTATVAAVQYDPSTGKVKAYTAAGAEIAAGTNLSTVTVEFIAIGLE